jgi:acetyl esterase/lipase
MKKVLYFVVLQMIIVCNTFAQKSSIDKSPVDYITDTAILYRDGVKEKLTGDMLKSCRLDVYYPVKEKKFATIVWFHGGGLTEGSRFVPDELKGQNLAVVAVEYRMNPVVKCPAYIDDAAASVAWVFKHIEEYGGDVNQIYVSGHSAGGYLTLMIGLDKRWLAHYDIDANRIAGLLPLSGQAVTHFTIRKERNIPEKQPIIDEFAPLYHVRADAPPLALITGDRELEILGRYEENAYLARMMKVAGHMHTTLYELAGFNHGEMAKPGCYLLLKLLKNKW